MRATSFIAVAALALCAGGCLPHVMHGPRIEDGASGQLSLTLGRNAEFDAGADDFRIVPSLYLGLRHGSVPDDSAGTAVSFGVQLPALLLPAFFEEQDGMEAMLAGSYADVYVQPKRRAAPGHDVGIGAQFSTHIFAPYLQAGWLDADGDGIYTTQQVGFMRDSDLSMLYMPTIAYRDHDPLRNLTANWSLTGAMARSQGETAVFIMVGGTFEFGRRPRQP